MAKVNYKKRNNTLVETAKQLVKEMSFDTGEFQIEDIVEILLPDFIYDPEKAKRDKCRDMVRASISNIRDADGDRIFIATGTDGNYAHIRRCFEIQKMYSAHENLSGKVNGEIRTLGKVKGQIKKITAAYEAVQEKHPAGVNGTNEA